MSLKVVIIEDDYIIQMFLEKAIFDVGCEVVGTADDSKAGLQLIEQKKPDLILMDIGIRGKVDGIETSRLISEKYSIPHIFITGNSDKHTLDRALQTNPIHIIHKPIDGVMLKNKFNQICKTLTQDIPAIV